MRPHAKAVLLMVLILSLCIPASSILANDEYNPDHCAEVAGTLNIYWESIQGNLCTGIEYTNGTLADAADGTVTMCGVSVSNPSCIGTACYEFTVAPDGLALSGSDTVFEVPMVLTRTASQACWVGHWIYALYDYVAHISVEPFLGPVPVHNTTWGAIKALYR